MRYLQTAMDSYRDNWPPRRRECKAEGLEFN